MRRTCYIVGGCLAIVATASACGSDDDDDSAGPSGGAAGSTGASSGTAGQGGTGASTGGSSGQGGRGGSGGSDCQCPSAAWEPVCGVDGNTYNAVCGADCVPVDIACVGECPCDAGGASCDIGCEAHADSDWWCESPTVEWVCGGGFREDLLSEIGCEGLATGEIRFCCPAGFLSACQ
jgi:hypothetical protein